MIKKLDITSQPVRIIIHALTWTSFILLPLAFIKAPRIENSFFISHSLGVMVLAGCYYVNTRLMIPRLLARKKIFLYILVILALIAANVFIQVEIERIVNPEMFKRHWFIFWKTRGAAFSAFLVLAIGAVMKITEEWFRNEKQKNEMENEKLSSELSFLKSQVSPHFLFNTLNNVYSLAYSKSDDAPEAILKLSHLMRYMLYDSDTQKVELGKEVGYLQNYIDLQRLRLPKSVKITFFIDGDPANIFIEPMLLIPFVENAFKHGISYRDPSDIHLKLHIQGTNLNFYAENSVSPVPPEAKDRSSGIGLQNVTKRLMLLYPGKHTLEVSEKENRYVVKLFLKTAR